MAWQNICAAIAIASAVWFVGFVFVAMVAIHIASDERDMARIALWPLTAIVWMAYAVINWRKLYKYLGPRGGDDA